MKRSKISNDSEIKEQEYNIKYRELNEQWATKWLEMQGDLPSYIKIHIPNTNESIWMVISDPSNELNIPIRKHNISFYIPCSQLEREVKMIYQGLINLVYSTLDKNKKMMP